MNTCHHWPLHPAPVEGEALSAWLHRVANCYEMNLMDLLLYEWGKGQITDLDIRPPDGFLETIAGRSGVDLDTLRCMTMEGWMPWLFDSFDLEDDALNCYVNQFSILLPQKNRPIRTVPGWRAWLPKQNLNRACPICISNISEKNIFKLMWQFPLFIGCPLHSCWLETYFGSPGIFYSWDNKDVMPRQTSYVITEMDRRTEQAFIYGKVELPRRKVHAGLWFRLLRTIIDELNTPLCYCGTQARMIRKIWERCDRSVRAGQIQWHPFEIFDVPLQLQFLEAAATAIYMIENQEIKAQGTLAYLFLPEPERAVDLDCHPILNQNTVEEEVNCWQIVQELLEKAFAEARYDPEVAERLFYTMLFGRRDPKVVKEVQDILSALGVPIEWCQIKNIDPLQNIK